MTCGNLATNTIYSTELDVNQAFSNSDCSEDYIYTDAVFFPDGYICAVTGGYDLESVWNDLGLTEIKVDICSIPCDD